MGIELKKFDTRLQAEGPEVKHLDPAAAPFYLPIGDEVEIFTAAYKARLPLLLKGPTGCGKTRFVEHMAHQLSSLANGPNELITVACHEDLTGSDLVGRFLIQADETVWVDGPLTQAVRRGAICYLDEVVEARKDTTVLIHPLSDHRRILPIEKRGETIEAHEGFLLVISYNPGYQSIQKNLKHSTRQRFVTIEFTYPPADKEVEIIAHEAGVEQDIAHATRGAGREGAASEGVGTGRRRLDPAADLRRRTDPPGNCAAARGDGRGHLVAHRRSGQQARDRRSSESDLSISCGKIRESTRINLQPQRGRGNESLRKLQSDSGYGRESRYSPLVHRRSRRNWQGLQAQSGPRLDFPAGLATDGRAVYVANSRNNTVEAIDVDDAIRYESSRASFSRKAATTASARRPASTALTA